MNKEKLIPILEEFAERILATQVNYISEREPDWPPITPRILLDLICRILGMDKETIKIKNRQREIVKARAIFMYVGSSIYGFTPSDMAHLLGGMNHATVRHHLQKYYDILDPTKPYFDKELDYEVRRIEAKLYEMLITCE